MRTARSALVRGRRRDNVGQAEDGVLHRSQHDGIRAEGAALPGATAGPIQKAAVIWIVDRTVGIIERNHES